MPTTADYLRQLQIDKQNLVANLREQGVEVSDNATFTDLSPKVLDVGGKPNIYVQTTEPTDKTGIWVQTDKTYDDVIVDEQVYASGVWEQGYVGDLQSTISSKLWYYNGDYYLASYIGYLFKLVGNSYEQITISNPSNVNLSSRVYCQIGSRLYSTNDNSDKYISYLDLEDMTIYKTPNIKSTQYPYIGTNGTKVEGGDGYIYCFNSNSSSQTGTYKYNYKIDVNNYTITEIATLPTALSTGGSINYYAYNWYDSGIRVGNIIYLFMTSPAQSTGLTDDDKKYLFCLKYDIQSNTFQQGYKTTLYVDKGYMLCPQLIDGKILIHATGYGVYTMDTANNDIISKFADDYDDVSSFREAEYGVGIINGNAYNMFCYTAYINGSSSTSVIKKRLQLDLTSKSYQGNKLILQQYPYNPKYMAQLFSINGLKEPITNIFLYNNNTMYANLPTYIGNGTAWTKIKG